MSEFEKKIIEITGLKSEAKFIQLWTDRDKDWSAMDHVEKHGLRCLKMLNNDKEVTWDSNQRSNREAKGRACLTLPVIGDFVNKAHGEFCMSAPSANVEPVDSEGDPKTAEVIKGLIYNVAYQFSGDAIHKDAAYYVFGAALAAWRVNTQFVSKDSFNVEPTIEALINPFAIRWDLTAKSPDWSDKKWGMILETIEKQSYIDKYGEDKWRPLDIPGSQGTSQELWFAKDKKAKLAEVWWVQEDTFTLYEQPDGSTSREKPERDEIEIVGKDGKIAIGKDDKPKMKKLRSRESSDLKVWSCIIDGKEILSEPTEWPDYTDNPIIPIMIATGRRLVIEGKIYFKSLITDGLDIAVLINYWVTAITEAVALQPDAPYLVTAGQIEGMAEWDDNTTKKKYLRYKQDPQFPNASPPSRQSPPQMSSGMMQMLEFLHSAMRNAIGMQQASMGMQGNEKSGVAIQKRKQEGDVGKFPFIENLQRQIELEAKVLTNILPSIYDTPRVERIMGPDGKSSLVYLKQADKSGKVLDLSIGKYDTRVTIGATFNTQRDEQRDFAGSMLDSLGKVNAPGAAALSPKFVKMMGTADAQEWADILISTLPPPVQALYKQDNGKGENVKIPPEMLQQMQQIGQKLQQAEQIMQQQAKELDALKREEGLKIAEIQAKKSMHEEDKKIEREKLMASMTEKEMEIKSRDKIATDKLEAEVMIKALEFMEGAKQKREALIAASDKLERERQDANRNESRPMLPESKGNEGEGVSSGNMSEVNGQDSQEQSPTQEEGVE